MCVVEIAARKRLEKPPALVTPVSVEVSEGTEAIVVEEDGEVSSVSSRVLAPAVRAWLWHVGTRAWFEIVVFSDVTTALFREMRLFRVRRGVVTLKKMGEGLCQPGALSGLEKKK